VATGPDPLKTRDAVDAETPARAATAARVGRVIDPSLMARYCSRIVSIESIRLPRAACLHSPPHPRTTPIESTMTASTLTPRLSARAWRNAVFAIFALNGLATATWISRVPAMRDLLDISSGEVGLLLLGVSSGSIVGLVLSSHVVNWIGGKATITLTLPMLAIGLIVLGVGAELLGSYAVVWIGFAIYGFATGLCDVAMNVEGAAVERVLDRNIMPWFHASWSLGSVLGAGIGAGAAFIGTELPELGIGVLLHLGALAVLVAVTAPFVVRSIPKHVIDDTNEETSRLSLRERMSIWLEPRTLLIGLIMLGMAFTEGSANDWLAIGFVDDRGFDNGQGALVFGVFTVAMTAGRLAGVPLLDRFGRVAVLRAASIAAAVGLAIVILVPVIPIAIAGVVLWGLGASLGFPVGMSAAADDPRTAAARVSAVATVGYAAFLIGPPLIGFVGEHIGVLNALWIVLGLIIVATIAIPAAREPQSAADGTKVDA
jgi:fucose permease